MTKNKKSRRNKEAAKKERRLQQQIDFIKRKQVAYILSNAKGYLLSLSASSDEIVGVLREKFADSKSLDILEREVFSPPTIYEPLNQFLLHLLYIVLVRCEAYRNLVNEFVQNFYFQLGPQGALLLSTHFVATAIEKHYIVHESDIRRLLHMLSPEKPIYSSEALAFDKELRERQLLVKQYRDEVNQFNELHQRQKQSSKLWDRRRLNKALEDQQEKVEELEERLKSINDTIEDTKLKIVEWLEDVRDALLIDKIELDFQKSIENLKLHWGVSNFDLFILLIQSLHRNDWLYEARSFSEAVADIFKNILFPLRARSAIIRSQAEFMRFAYQKSIMKLSGSDESQYEIDGPTYLSLGTDVKETDVSFLIVGPTVENIIIRSSASERRTQLEIEPGQYSIVCEHPQAIIPPLILEGECLPGRTYPVFVTMVKSEEGTLHQKGTSKIGEGVSINAGLFSVIDIDPRHHLNFLYGDKEYQIDKFLGEGSGGIVYRAFELETKSAWAFKILTSDLLGQNTQIQIGRKEWETYNKLSSKQNVVQIISYSDTLKFFQHGKQLENKILVSAYQMEFAELGNLRAFIERMIDRKLLITDVLTIIKEILVGLESIHNTGLIHRDIRPENILVFRSQPQFKVCDFTLTRNKSDLVIEQLTSALNSRLTKIIFNRTQEMQTIMALQSIQRNIRSTTFYASPEEHAGNKELNPMSDIYSVGGILYWLLVGFDPFELLLQEQYRELYERYKLGVDRKILHLDIQRSKALFGDLVELQMRMREANLKLKESQQLSVEFDEINVLKVSKSAFPRVQELISKSLHPEPDSRFRNATEMKAAVEDLERMI